MFDKVFAFFYHHYVRDFRKFLKVFREILKPEGYVICLGIASAHTFSAWLELSTKEEWKKYLIVSRKVFCLKKSSPVENFDKFLEDERKVVKRYKVECNTEGPVTAQQTFIEMFLQYKS
ncbi:uncharacterized protein LOC143238930 [Tachypleus tridentatus]|uniref:uncharacterized protein LOC143238930 n=1 Tax=Tachypleus tridentatus TaxID=6853 RepID=UPI003FD3540E